ncbi:MAG: hypothetical protein GX944_00840 [Alphaproteobacteria bacterium]|nr:hypothetical protein [Alphaproteobacteria bacterium]
MSVNSIYNLNTSDDNIKKILEQNNCKSIEGLNYQEVISLKLYELSGYLDLSEFTQRATKLKIYNFIPEITEWERLRNKNIIEEIKIAIKHPTIILDASKAGDFEVWQTDDCRKWHFIKEIILRHPNQVLLFGINDYLSSSMNNDLDNLFETAKQESIKRNIEEYYSGEQYKDFKQHLNKINIINKEIQISEINIKHYCNTIEKLQSNLQTVRNNVKKYKQEIEQELKSIEAINNNSQFPIKISDIQILEKGYWKTRAVYPGNEQHNPPYIMLTERGHEELIERNKMFYKNKTKTR